MSMGQEMAQEVWWLTAQALEKSHPLTSQEMLGILFLPPQTSLLFCEMGIIVGLLEESKK